MTFPKSSLRAQIVATLVFVAFSAGLIAFARSFRATADAALSEEPFDAPEPARPHSGPLTPRNATSARELLGALIAALGNNARGVPCVTYVDYDRHPDRLHITFALDKSNATAPGSRTAALKRMRDVLEAVRDGDMQWRWVLMTGTAAVRDKQGTPSETTVIRAQFDRERLKKLDLKALPADDLPSSAEQFWTYADLGR